MSLNRQSDHLDIQVTGEKSPVQKVRLKQIGVGKPLFSSVIDLRSEADQKLVEERVSENEREEFRILLAQIMRDLEAVNPPPSVDTASVPARSGFQVREEGTASEPVDGLALLNEVHTVIGKHAVVSVDAAVAITLWIAHTYAIDLASHSPILAIVSPEKRSGKTTLLRLLLALVHRPVLGANMSTAVVYRIMEQFAPTLLIDEADTWLYDKDLLGILNGGHERQGAYVWRCSAKEQDCAPQAFYVWGAKAIAKIGGFIDTLADRSIHIRMRRKKGVELTPLPHNAEEGYAIVRGRFKRWTLDYASELQEANPQVPDALLYMSDRAVDNWRPLFAIADRVGGDWPARARTAAVALCGAEIDESPQLMLLADMRTVFQERDTDRIATSDIITDLSKMANRPWAQYSRGHNITSYDLAKLLKLWEIRSKKMRITTGKAAKYGYEVKDFTAVFAEYLPEQTVTMVQEDHEEVVGATSSERDGRSDVLDVLDSGDVWGEAGSHNPEQPSNGQPGEGHDS